MPSAFMPLALGFSQLIASIGCCWSMSSVDFAAPARFEVCSSLAPSEVFQRFQAFRADLFVRSFS